MEKKKILRAFASQLRLKREKASMSQRDLAFAAECEKSTIQRLEYAQTDPKLTTLYAMAKGLKIELPGLVEFHIKEEDKNQSTATKSDD